MLGFRTNDSKQDNLKLDMSGPSFLPKERLTVFVWPWNGDSPNKTCQ